MGAMKRFYEECAEAGRCPVSEETWSYLDRLERADAKLDWIGYTEHEYVGHDGRLYLEDCIDVESARRLVAEGLANDAIEFFVRVLPSGEAAGYDPVADREQHQRHYKIHRDWPSATAIDKAFNDSRQYASLDEAMAAAESVGREVEVA